MVGKIKYLLFCLAILLVSDLNASEKEDTLYYKQNDISQEKQLKTLSFNLPIQAFFKDNEYKRKIAFGYTLPGVRLVPSLEYKPFEQLSISLGVNLLRYWGQDFYGSYNFLGVPYYTDTNIEKQFHWKPYFRLTYKPNDRLRFVVGNIDNSYCHLLPQPLYNEEYVYSADYEEGLQMFYKGKYFTNEIWLNWQNFNLYNDIDREELCLGISGNVHTDNKHSFFANYALMWQHHGGELDTLQSLPLDHWLNFRIGAEYKLLLQEDNFLDAGFDCYFSKSLKNDTWGFSSGKAFYPYLQLKYNSNSMSIGYFYSKEFISLFGNSFFSNLAQRDKNVTYPVNKMITFNYQYLLPLDRMITKNYSQPSKYNMYLFAQLYYKLDSKNSIEQEDKTLSFALGVRITIDEKFHLISF